MEKKAPGKSQRKGLTFIEIIKKFPDNTAAEAWFAEQRWPEGPHCPHCGSINVQSGAKHATMPYRCRDCRKRFSAKTCTPMQSSNLGYQVWAIAIYLLTTSLKGVSSMKLHRDLGITQKSAWHLAHRLRKAWETEGTVFLGPVEIDETYIGGKEKNKHKSNKLNAGRGAIGKVAVVGVKDRSTNQVKASTTPSTTGKTLKAFVHKHVAKGATIYTDDNRAYSGLANHETVKHSVGEYVRNQAHTNGIESFWAIMKRGYYGTYHKMSPKHLDRYVAEFSARQNLREMDTADQMAFIARNMSGKSLLYRRLVA